ncbi:MerR family transcriptional regulator [Desulfohalobiaceae bacterium Ax17]|uniref:MerR family transcriptional regulator n=1 Tax=Desulfovulcanus ferrireducens TaxID=2831190 RepID=UPI00207BA9DA|nr:MerR family transcriptional regulator [Desulfovulcanus ferrireducens]MBT8762843.1 MerR family transcriptional regulator [Desulfovulcanus ferrireducens]
MAGKKEKLYKIGQAAKMLGLESYVLRFWEKEFPQLKPLRTSKGQRLYTEEHIKLIKKIKTLLYEDRLTIEGAKMRLEEQERWSGLLLEIKKELEEIRHLLGQDARSG